ncbi:MAG: Gfo/Idh/MocA family oxidoreductase [Clostridia bacterium]|nr:Gfo/Idh/MocA family oxidoreductase [Clostridia bacterium]
MKKIRVGVFGVGRGMYLAEAFMLLDAEIVAICDNHKERREAAMAKLDSSVAAYESFDEFIEHPMDAVILANNFYQHAPYAVECFKRNLHVFCECTSNGTMGEGVELVRAFEKSNSIYMLAENYPQMLFNREMKRIADSGTLGKILYAEGEYNHPVSAWDTDFTKNYKFYPKHWRHFLPRTYYVTHSLGPIMNATGATPKKVTAFAMYDPYPDDTPNASYNADRAANITTFNDDGSVFRFTACAGFGAHHNSYRLCGTKGQIENLRGMGEQVMLRYNAWDTPEGEERKKLYTPEWNDKDEELIKKSGHGGGDFLTVRMFVDCIKQGKQPPHPFDIYSATVMSSVAILSHRSVLEDGKVYDLPDFRREEDRKLYENDYLTPFWGDDGSAPTLPCCSHPDYKPTERQMELYFEELKKS